MRNFINSIIFLILATLLLPLVFADINVPASDATVGGSAVVLNSTNASLPSMLNCTFYAQSSLTANSSWVQIAFQANTSANPNAINATFDSRGLEDANNYDFNATCRNDTSARSTRNTGIDVDNTIPQAPTSLSPGDATEDADGSISFSGTVTGANTTSCTLRFVSKNPGSSSYTMTHSGNDCTYTLSSAPEEAYQWYIRASDETNTTDSSTQTVRVDIPTSSSKIVAIAQEEGIEVTAPSRKGGFYSITSLNNGFLGNEVLGISILGWVIIIVIGIFVIRAIRK